MKNKVFLIDTNSISKKDFFEKELPGSVYDDKSYSLTYDGKTYDVHKWETIGLDLGDIGVYGLEIISK